MNLIVMTHFKRFHSAQYHNTYLLIMIVIGNRKRLLFYDRYTNTSTRFQVVTNMVKVECPFNVAQAVIITFTIETPRLARLKPRTSRHHGCRCRLLLPFQPKAVSAVQRAHETFYAIRV